MFNDYAQAYSLKCNCISLFKTLCGTWILNESIIVFSGLCTKCSWLRGCVTSSQLTLKTSYSPWDMTRPTDLVTCVFVVPG